MNCNQINTVGLDFEQFGPLRFEIHVVNAISNTGKSGNCRMSAGTKSTGMVTFETRPRLAGYGGTYLKNQGRRSCSKGVAKRYPLQIAGNDVQKLDAIAKGLRSMHILGGPESRRHIFPASRRPTKQNLLIVGFEKQGAQ